MTSYTDLDNIGSGGFGDVWTCRRDGDDSVYAKKILQEGIDKDGIERFVREVRILASLDHPNIIPVLSRQLSAKPYFYIMPWYECSLFDQLDTVVRDEGRIRKIFGTIVDAIEYAHSQGVIHRDLKPENVLMNGDTDVVISDFGLGRMLDSKSTRRTQTGFRMGTPFYVAPEQLTDAKRTDERSDIFSLGRMLYELYTGEITSAVQDLTQLPPGVSLIVDKCTQQIPDRRFQSVVELKQAWLSLFDATGLETELDELLKLRSDLSIPGETTEEDASRLLELLMRHEDDTDLLHETIMQIDVGAIVQMHKANTGALRRILDQFTNLNVSQGWGFSYTDKIGNRCKAIFYALEDFEIRAMMIWCVMEVGVSHNRYHVLEIFSDLIQQDKQPGEHLPIIDRLIVSDERTRTQAADWVKGSQLHPAILPLFQFEQVDQAQDFEDLPF